MEGHTEAGWPRGIFSGDVDGVADLGSAPGLLGRRVQFRIAPHEPVHPAHGRLQVCMVSALLGDGANCCTDSDIH